MAHRGLAVLVVVALVVAGCRAAPPAASTNAAPATGPRDYGVADAAWGKFHSQRFRLTVPLPDGKSWKIDDHHLESLVAVHAATSSRLTVLATREDELMNRARCEERARALGWLGAAGERMMTVEDQVYVGPEAYDSRVWVALDADQPGGAVGGHVFLFGAFLRQCLLVHLTTTVPSSRNEDVLAKRLAVGNARIVKGITLDPLRTTDDAAVPREKQELRK